MQGNKSHDLLNQRQLLEEDQAFRARCLQRKLSEMSLSILDSLHLVAWLPHHLEEPEDSEVKLELRVHRLQSSLVLADPVQGHLQGFLPQLVGCFILLNSVVDRLLVLNDGLKGGED